MISAEQLVTNLSPRDSMSQDAFMRWKEECETVHNEMDRLLAAGWLEAAEERQVRKIRFMALIERRNVAAHNLLKKSDGDAARLSTKAEPMLAAKDVNISQKMFESASVDRGPRVLPDDPKFEFNMMNVTVCQEPFEIPLAVERDHQAPPADPVSEVEAMNDKVSQERPEAALATDRSPEVASADPMTDARNFLKFLRLR
jgi:hypothetical protein